MAAIVIPLMRGDFSDVALRNFDLLVAAVALRRRVAAEPRRRRVKALGWRLLTTNPGPVRAGKVSR